MKRGHLLLVAAAFILTVTSVWADPIVNEIYYQKKTLLSYPATRFFRFSLWLEETGGATPIWSEEKSYPMTNAYVKTYLGRVNPLDGVDFSEQLWVQVELKKKDGTYVVLGQRDQFGATPYGVVPYAMYALDGAVGPQGPEGPMGPQGPAGPMGPTGATGATGATGQAGHSPVLTWSGDRIAIDGSVTGPHLTGPQGPAGIPGISRVVHGRINWNGAIGHGSGDFTTTKINTGNYNITFNSPFPGTPNCVAHALTDWAICAATSDSNASLLRVFCSHENPYLYFEEYMDLQHIRVGTQHVMQDQSFTFLCVY